LCGGLPVPISTHHAMLGPGTLGCVEAPRSTLPALRPPAAADRQCRCQGRPRAHARRLGAARRQAVAVVGGRPIARRAAAPAARGAIHARCGGARGRRAHGECAALEQQHGDHRAADGHEHARPPVGGARGARRVGGSLAGGLGIALERAAPAVQRGLGSRAGAVHFHAAALSWRETAHTSVLQPRTHSVSGSTDDTVNLARGALCSKRVPHSQSLMPRGARQAHTSATAAAAPRRQGAQQVVELVAEADERAAHGVARGRKQLAQVREAAPQRRHQRLHRPAAVALATPLRRPPGRAKCGPRLTSGPHLSSVHVE